MTTACQCWRDKLTDKKATYQFEEGNATMRGLLGGKGANLAEMKRLGIPVPDGFTITTEVCNAYYEVGKVMPAGLEDEIREQIAALAKKMDKGFGDAKNPLLVSVRSGAKFSMPGMMDTILNLGLNDETVEGLAALTNDARFAYDAYRRFIMMFSDVVMDLPKSEFEKMLRAKKEAEGVTEDSKLSADALKDVVKQYKAFYKAEKGNEFPQNVYTQLFEAVLAVFRSWMNERAIIYRNREKIDHKLGTAVNVQAMCFGNMGENSGTGVAFSRDYNDGTPGLVGDFLLNAQGEDVVAGIRKVSPIDELKRIMPESYEKLNEIANKLEQHYKEMQDMEFTIQQGRLFMLQTRNGKRTATAAVKIAVDMVEEGLISKEEAVMRVQPEQLDRLLHPFIPEKSKKMAIENNCMLAKGTAASPGAACGRVVFDKNEAVRVAATKEPVIMVRVDTTPEDAAGMLVAKGILTSTGGPSSHAALVARGWGIPCVVGCDALHIDIENKKVTVGDRSFGDGDYLTIDGSTGEVMLGKIPLEDPNDLTPETKTLLGWADEAKKLKVYANADNPRDAKRARNFGAVGIGLCRTEHMFMESERLPIVQEMILIAAEAEQGHRARLAIEKELAEATGNQKAKLEQKLAEHDAKTMPAWNKYHELLGKLLEFQRGDFRGILEAMQGNWVTIRLIDPPLHEFLPKHGKLFEDVVRLKTLKAVDEKAFEAALAEIRKVRGPEVTLESLTALLARVEQMSEANPMLGLRVCRLGIVFPEIVKMQVRGIMEAACDLRKNGVDAKPKVMIPGVGTVEEMRWNRKMVTEVADKVIAETGVPVEYHVGTMVEIPRAALTAGDVATEAEFFSFGTNDLSQTTFGYSRDDAAKTFVPVYLDQHILKADPFQVLDQVGVGRLMKMAVKEGRETRGKDMEIGICGEHGGEPSSVGFCHEIGLTYVSCSPYRVPIARLAAAHAAIKEKRNGQGASVDLR
ncbi:MAG: pyruvate, phosphate dikinase [bacterium]|nr:pyruvate, phosphate dikinase [bacterium]